MFRRILLQMPIIKQIHNRSLEEKARKKIEEAMEEVFEGLPSIKEIENAEELNRLIKKDLAGRGIEVKGGLKIYKKSYKCPICNSKFNTIEGEDGLEKHLEVVHLKSFSEGGKR